MVDELISTDNLKMVFNSADAFEAIVCQIVFALDKNMIGRLHPSEVMKVAADALQMIFRTMADDIQHPEVIKHLTCLIVTKCGLSALIDPRFMPKEANETRKDIH